jgi:hypothetical protein
MLIEQVFFPRSSTEKEYWTFEECHSFERTTKKVYLKSAIRVGKGEYFHVLANGFLGQ